MTVTDELLAELEDGAKGASHWNLDACFQIVEEGYLPDELYWHIGHYDEGNQYPVLLVDTDQYDAPPEDAKAVARHYANCGSRKITAIVAELRRLRAENAELAKDAGRYRWMRDGAGYCDTRDIPGMAPLRMDEYIDTAMECPQ